MDDKTEELRDIFLSVSEEETVTETQTEDRGSLADRSSESDAGLEELLERLREKFGFEVAMSDEKRCELIEQFYTGDTDRELAETLDTDPETVFRARMELHLLRDDEPTLPEETVELIREHDGLPPGELASETGATAEQIRRARAVLEARDRSRRVSRRFRIAYEERLTDVNLTDQLTVEAHEDGLEDATEGAETDVEF